MGLHFDSNATMTTPTLASVSAQTTSVTSNIFIFFCAVLVFFMHTGFAMLECGGVQSKNRQAILIKNVMLIATSAISWWAFGFMFAGASDNANHFIGNNKDLMFLGQDGKD